MLEYLGLLCSHLVCLIQAFRKQSSFKQTSLINKVKEYVRKPTILRKFNVSCRMVMSTEPIHGQSEPDLLLPCDDQKTWASPQPRASSREACQPRGTKTIAQAFKSCLATLTGEVLAEDIQYSKKACNIAISGNIEHLVYLLRLSAALGFT